MRRGCRRSGRRRRFRRTAGPAAAADWCRCRRRDQRQKQLTRDSDDRHVDSAIVLFTLTTVLTGIVLALLQALGSENSQLFCFVFLLGVIVTSMLLLPRSARTAMDSIRRFVGA
jgi:hypothetical protein